MDRNPFSGRGNHIRSGSRLGSVPANALGNFHGHSVSTIVVRDSNGPMGKDCHRADQSGHGQIPLMILCLIFGAWQIFFCRKRLRKR
jgi:hypothetical protein